MSKTAINEHTGKAIKTKSPSDSYMENWDRIFGKREVEEEPWYVTEYNAGVWVKDIYYKALSQEDTEAQNWLIAVSGMKPEDLMNNI